jgi:hypothetical protein
MFCFNLTKNVWATFWAIFFSSSSGHPAPVLRENREELCSREKRHRKKRLGDAFSWIPLLFRNLLFKKQNLRITNLGWH